MAYCPYGSCPMNCHIVPHPDQPAQSFCVNCSRRFSSDEENNQPLSFLQFAIAALIVMLLVGWIVAEDKPESDSTSHHLLITQQLA